MDPTSAQGPGNQQPPAQGGIAQSPPSQPASANSIQTSQPVQQAAQPTQPPQQFTQATVVQPTPQTQVPQEPEDKPKKSKVKIIGILLVVLFLMFFVTTAVLGYAVAYEKVKLRNYPEIQATVAGYVQSLPFMPKTAKFLIIRSIIAHQNVTKHSFDISLALDSSSLNDVLGINKFDTEAKGSIDYSNPENIIFSLNASLTKEFNIELKSNDPILYFKVNKFPSFIFSLIGINDEMVKPYLERWIAYDTTPLDTQARKELNDKEVEPLSKELLVDINEKYLDDYIIDKMQISKITEDGVKYYKISLEADKELIDYFGKKLEEESKGEGPFDANESFELSEMIKELSWEIYIARDTYYTHKLKVTSVLEFDEGFYGGALLGTSADLVQNSQANFALVIKLDEFGKEVIVETPSEYTTYEDLLTEIGTVASRVYTGGLSELSGSADAQRVSDLMILQTVLELYMIECTKYPNSIQDLTDEETEDVCGVDGNLYLEDLPKDPDGSNYYYKVAEGGNNFDLCAKLDVPKPELDTCPNSDFNYHLTAP